MPARTAATRCPDSSALVGLRNPITVAGCASATSGHAAAAVPRSVMNSRRLIVAPKGQQIVATFALAQEEGRCPLWVISGHFALQSRCLLWPQKRHQMRHMEMSAKGQ